MSSLLTNTFIIHLDVSRTLRGEYGGRSSRLDQEDPTSSVMHVGAPIMNDGEIVGVLTVYKPQRSMLLFIIETKQRLLQLGLLAVAVVLLLGWLLSKWVTFPLRRLTEYAAAVAKGESPPAPVMPGRHLRILGETTEAMREVLENRKYVESYVQWLNHEMKSPIAGIRGASELLHRDLPPENRVQFLDNIRTESVRLQNLVDQLGTCGKESPMSLGFLRCFLFETGFAASIGIARMHRSQRKVLAGADRPLPFEFAMAGEVMCLG